INRVEQLRMFLSGPGGTGKFRVIDVLRDCFELRGQSRRFRLAAYTGVTSLGTCQQSLWSSASLESLPKSVSSDGGTQVVLVCLFSNRGGDWQCKAVSCQCRFTSAHVKNGIACER
ncbi:hypothetical protein B0H10DRAFT_1831240, partial [Mycena sp. CBHHK59/15]